MKKIIKVILVFVLSFFYISILISCKENDSIRLRIVASSNNLVDQDIKNEVKEYLKLHLKDIDLYDLSKLENKLNDKFLNQSIKVDLVNDYFEAKAYKGKIIQSGYYKTLLITINEGKGKNFWTILYPEFFNICFEEDNEIEYRSFIYDLLNK